MEEEQKQVPRGHFWIWFGVELGAGVIVAALYLLLVGFFTGTAEQATDKMLSDALLLPGVILLAVGVLSWVRSKGFFDLAGYATFSLFGFFIPRLNKENRAKSFYDYKVKKDRKGRHWLPTFLASGLLLFAASILIAVLL